MLKKYKLLLCSICLYSSFDSHTSENVLDCFLILSSMQFVKLCSTTWFLILINVWMKQKAWIIKASKCCEWKKRSGFLTMTFLYTKQTKEKKIYRDL